MNTRIISFVNHKGGVGKTTSVMNIGVALVKFHQKRVLLIDIDPQANLSTSLGMSDRENKSIYHALIENTALPIAKTNEGVDIVVSHLDLVNAENALMSEVGSEKILSSLLKPIQESYDYILIDCPPSLGILTRNALSASSDVIIIAQAEYLALRGVGQLLLTLDKVKNRINENLNLTGVIITQYQSNFNLSKKIEETIIGRFEDEVFKTKIRSNIHLAESVANSESIFGWNDKSNGAKDYQELTEEIVKRYDK